MSRALSTARETIVRWLGFKKELHPPNFKQAAKIYTENGAIKVSYRNLYGTLSFTNSVTESRQN